MIITDAGGDRAELNQFENKLKSIAMIQRKNEFRRVSIN
jgi:hypothetical protein